MWRESGWVVMSPIAQEPYDPPKKNTQTANASVQTNVVQLLVGSSDFARVLLRGVTQLVHSHLSKVGVIIKVELGVHTHDYEEADGGGRSRWQWQVMMAMRMAVLRQR